MSRTEKDFFEWLSGESFYHGTTRYGQFPGHHVFVVSKNFGFLDENLRDLLDCLEGSDGEAVDAGFKLGEMADKKEIWLAYNNNPIEAMTNLIDQIKDFYFNELNNSGQSMGITGKS